MECGGFFFNIHAHRGSKACQAASAANVMQGQGFVRMLELPKRFAKHAAPRALSHLVRWEYTRANTRERWLPKWACAVLLGGCWDDEIVRRAEDNRDLQIALALEYDLRRQEG